MWTPEITSKTIENGRLKANVLFKHSEDETRNFSRDMYATSDLVLKTNIRAEIQNADSVDSLDKAVAVGDVAEDFYAIPLKDEDQQSREVWFERLKKWVRVKQLLVDTNVCPISQEEISGLLAEVKRGYRPEYLDFI